MNNTAAEIPVIAYYGTGRGSFSVHERKRGFAGVQLSSDAISKMKQPSVAFSGMIAYYEEPHQE